MAYTFCCPQHIEYQPLNIQNTMRSNVLSCVAPAHCSFPDVELYDCGCLENTNVMYHETEPSSDLYTKFINISIV